MSYKTDSERAHNILYCLTPPRILINSAAYVNGKQFSDRFKKEGFSVLSVGKFDSRIANEQMLIKIKKFWESPSQNPVVVEGYFPMAEDISNVFTGVYSYVYLYPNTLKSYAGEIIAMIHSSENHDSEIRRLRELEKTGDPLFKSDFEKFVRGVADKNREIYKEHCDMFDDKILTVLI